jgi:hypothetical protein
MDVNAALLTSLLKLEHDVHFTSFPRRPLTDKRQTINKQQLPHLDYISQSCKMQTVRLQQYVDTILRFYRR